AHLALGVALNRKGLKDEAITALKEAIRLRPNSASAHYNFGVVLVESGSFDESIAANQEAIKLDPNYAEAHCNLGHALRGKGRFTEALAALQRGHELGSKRQNWSFPSAEWVRHSERLVAWDAKLAAVLDGKAELVDAAKRVELAMFCAAYKKWYLLAAQWY